MAFTRILAQTAESRIWTLVTDSIFYGDICYDKCASLVPVVSEDHDDIDASI